MGNNDIFTPYTRSFKKITGGITASWIRFVISIGVAIFQLPILYANFDKSVIGYYLLFSTLSIFLSISDLGLGSVIGRTVSYNWGANSNHTQDQWNDKPNQLGSYATAPISELFSSCLFAYSIASLLVVATGSIAGHLFFSPDPNIISHSELTNAWIIFLIASGISLVNTVPLACISGVGDVGWENLIRTIVQVGRLISILVLAPMTHSILALAVAELVLNLGSVVISLLILKFRQPTFLQLSLRFNINLLTAMFRDAFPVFITRLGALLILQSSPLIVGYSMGTKFIPDFMALRQLAYLGIAIPSAIPSVVSPFVSAAFSAGELEKIRKYHSLTLKTTLATAVLWFIGFTAWGPALMDLWLGKGHFLGPAVAIPLAIMALLETHHTAHSSFAWSVGRWPFAPWGIASGVLTLILALTGGHWFGYVGIALGGMIAQLVTNNWFAVVYTLRVLEISLLDYCKRIGLPILLYGTIIAIIATTSTHLLEKILTLDWVFRGLQGNSLIALVFGAILTSLAGITLTWIYLLRSSERDSILVRFSKT
ncbi:Polysaccharide biosynthesis protein [compost metagenome]